MYNMVMTKFTAIILAAGKGTRFKSERPKVLHEIQSKPLVHHVIDAVRACEITNICLVVGYKRDDILSACEQYEPEYAIQDKQLGTGHAVMCAIPKIKELKKEHCIILAGDCPLIQPTTLKTLIQTHISSNAAATLLTGRLQDAGGYGRIIRTESNQLLAIREAKDCTPDELKITEFNSGIYCFKSTELIKSIEKISTNNAQNEYYLTDIIELLHGENKTLSSHCIDTVYEVLGANTQEELAELNNAANKILSL